jgi:DNA repair photolyase
MSLNKTKGNMYDFITHTWNPIKGICFHGCDYCYMKRKGNLKPVRLDEKELKTDLGNGNFIFVGSSCDMWASNISIDWINRILEKTFEAKENRYLFQSKNPARFDDFLVKIRRQDTLATTIETNRYYPEMGFAVPMPKARAEALFYIEKPMITVEPIMDFDLAPFVDLIKSCKPVQVNIGADSGNNHLPEPPKEKVIELILELQKFTTVYQKKNLRRLVA